MEYSSDVTFMRQISTLPELAYWHHGMQLMILPKKKKKGGQTASNIKELYIYNIVSGYCYHQLVGLYHAHLYLSCICK